MFAVLFRLVCCSIIVLLALSQPAMTSPVDPSPIVSSAYFKDADGSLTIDQITGKQFVPLQGLLAAGYTSGAEWLRLVIRPPGEGGELVLRILPSYLNEITLFEPDPQRPGGWHTQITGNNLPWHTHSYPSMALGFSIHPVTETTYYLRLKTSSNSLLQVAALKPVVAAHTDIRQGLWQGVYLAIILWIVLWALQDYLLTRDRVIAGFAATQAVHLLYLLAIMGYWAILMPQADFLPVLTFYLVTLAVLASLLFHRQLLTLFAPSRHAIWAMNALVTGSVTAFVLLMAGQLRFALQLNSLVTLLAAPILLMVAMTTRKDAFPGRVVLVAFYGILFLSLLSYVPPLLGWGVASAWALNGALFQGLISAILIGLLLHRRARKLIDQEVQGQLTLALSRQQLEEKRDKLAEQSRFMAMLTHELKTPLAVARLSVDTLKSLLPPGARDTDAKGRERISRALDNINTIVDRCAQVDLLEQGTAPLVPTDCDIVALVSDVLAASSTPQRLYLCATASNYKAHSDRALLSVVIANLIDNALKYSPPETRVDISITADCRSAVDGISIRVTNQAGHHGVPDPERMFDKYYRGEHAGRQSGSGLGLYLVKGIAEQLGAVISYNHANDTVSFTLWLPITPR